MSTYRHAASGPPDDESSVPRAPASSPSVPDIEAERRGMRGELAYSMEITLGRIWDETERWISSGGEPIEARDPVPAGPLRVQLRAIASRLRELQHLVCSPVPSGEVGPQVRQAAARCADVSAWAEGTGAMHTALAFAHLAVRAAPDVAAHAYRISRLLRKRGDDQGSWEWLRWVLRLARDEGDRKAFTRSLAGMGALYTEGSQLFGGKRYWRMALRHARANGMEDVVADALYGLCVAELRSGDYEAGVSHGAEALKALAPEDLRVGLLAHNVAALLIEHYGHYEPGFLLLEVLRSLAPEEPDPLLRHAYRARAAAGMRLHAAYEEAWSQTCALLGSWRADPSVAGTAWIHLAHAAALLRQWRRSFHAASRARDVTSARPYSLPAGDGRMIQKILLAGGDRLGRIREEFIDFEAPDAVDGSTELFYDQVVRSLGARSAGERVGLAAEVPALGGPRPRQLASRG